MADWEISHSQPGDEAFFALIQTESWKAAFRDILTPEALENATQLPKATAMYRRLLEQHIGHGYLLRVEQGQRRGGFWSGTDLHPQPAGQLAQGLWQPHDGDRSWGHEGRRIHESDLMGLPGKPAGKTVL